jgi:putative hydrolase of the HAD superfamily
MLFSDEVGVRKPDPRIFRIAAEKLGVAPNEIIHVGDNLKSDVWGAKNAGFTAVYLSTETGRDRIAESDPASLVAISRDLGILRAKDIVPYRVITSLSMIEGIIENLE